MAFSNLLNDETRKDNGQRPLTTLIESFYELILIERLDKNFCMLIQLNNKFRRATWNLVFRVNQQSYALAAEA